MTLQELLSGIVALGYFPSELKERAIAAAGRIPSRGRQAFLHDLQKLDGEFASLQEQTVLQYRDAVEKLQKLQHASVVEAEEEEREEAERRMGGALTA